MAGNRLSINEIIKNSVSKQSYTTEGCGCDDETTSTSWQSTEKHVNSFLEDFNVNLEGSSVFHKRVNKSFLDQEVMEGIGAAIGVGVASKLVLEARSESRK